jgi:hypothetical protein
VGKVVKLTSRNALQIGTKLGRATQSRKVSVITTVTSTFKMVNTTSEDIIADPRAAVTKLFGMDGEVSWLIVDAACKDGTPDVSTDFTIPHTFEAAFSDPVQLQKVPSFERNAHVRSRDSTNYLNRC